MIASLITELKTLEVEEQSIQESRKRATNQLKCLDQQLDALIEKRSQVLSELEFACGSELSDDNEFHSLTSDVDIPGIFSDSESIPQKRKSRSNASNNSDTDLKKIKSTDEDDSEELECPKTIDEVNNCDQQMIDRYIDDMADQLAKEYRNPDDHLKEALVVLASEPDFESLVNDVENDSLSNSSRTITMEAIDHEFSPISFANVTIRDQCRNPDKTKENITPPDDCGLSQTFQLSPNDSSSAKKDHNCNYFAADHRRCSPPFAASDVLKGRKLLTNLMSNNNALDEISETKKSLFSPSVDTKPKSFRDQMRLWKERENSANTECKPKRWKTN